MRLKEYITIDRPKDIVWEHIYNPIFMQKWNPRVKSIQPSQANPPGLKFRFTTHYEMLGEPNEFEGEVIQFHKNSKLVMMFVSTSGLFKGFITGGFELYDSRKGTRLCYYLDFSDSGINLYTQILLYFTGLFNRFTGKQHLKTLKNSIEI